MASRTGINISGHNAVSTNALAFLISTLNSKKLKGRTELYFILVSKLNNNQKRCFNFGLRRDYLNGCKFELK